MSGGNIKGAVFRAASRAALREEGERGGGGGGGGATLREL